MNRFRHHSDRTRNWLIGALVAAIIITGSAPAIIPIVLRLP